MRLVKIIISLSILLLTFSQTYSQSKTVAKANKIFERFAYENAIDLYLKAIENDETSIEIYSNLGDSYFQNADMENAVIWYEKLMNHDLTNVKGEYYFRYSQALKAIGEYAKSDYWLERLADLNANDSRASSLIYDPNYLEKIEAQSNRYSIKTVRINSEYSDFAAGFDNDGGIIFSSSRDAGVSQKITHRWTGLPFLQLYTARISENGKLTNAQKLQGDFNTKYNESSVAITNDGKYMYFSGGEVKENNKLKYNKQGVSTIKLQRASLDQNNNWTITDEDKNVMEFFNF